LEQSEGMVILTVTWLGASSLCLCVHALLTASDGTANAELELRAERESSIWDIACEAAIARFSPAREAAHVDGIVQARVK